MRAVTVLAPRAWRSSTWLVLGALLIAAEALLLLDPRTGAMDLEEGLTPVGAHLLGWLPAWQAPTTLYRPFCGGCLVGSIVARPVFAVVGDPVWAWKLTLVPYVVAWVVGGTLVARRVAGDRAAHAHLLLCALAPPVLAEASVRGWTNHFEATALALIVLAAAVRPEGPRRPVATGLLAGLSLWVSWSAIPTLAAAAWALRATPSGRRVALAATWAAVPLGWTWAVTGDPPWALRGLAPVAEVDVAGQLAALLDPARALLVMDAHQLEPVRAVAGWAALLVGLVVATRRPGPGRLPAVAIGVWLVGYLLGPARLDTAVPPMLWSNRYLVPVLVHLVLATAIAAGRTTRPWAAALLVVAAAWPGASAQARRLGSELTTAHLLAPSPSWTWFRRALVDTVPFAEAVPCPAGDDACRDLVAYRHGWRVARGIEGVREGDADDVAFAAGWGAGVAAQPKVPEVPVSPPLRLTAEAERLAVALSLVATTDVVDVPSAWWVGQHGPAEVPAGIDDDARAALAYGWGQRWTLERGAAAHPEIPGWTEALERDFARGARQARARPWLAVLPP